MLRYAYFPGCVAQGACHELHQSTIAISQALDIELIELKKSGLLWLWNLQRRLTVIRRYCKCKKYCPCRIAKFTFAYPL